MDFTNLYQMSSFLCIEAVQIRYMLEIVCIQVTGIQSQIRLYIVCIFYNL